MGAQLQPEQTAKLTRALESLWPHLSIFKVLPELTLAGAGELFFDDPGRRDVRPGPGIQIGTSGRERLADLITVLSAVLSDRVAEQPLKQAVIKWLKSLFALNSWTKPNLPSGAAQELFTEAVKAMGIEEDFIVAFPVAGAALPNGRFEGMGLTLSSTDYPELEAAFESLNFRRGVVPSSLAHPDPRDTATTGFLDSRVVCLTRLKASESNAATRDGYATVRDVLGVLNMVLHYSGFANCRVCLVSDDFGAHKPHYTVSRKGRIQHGQTFVGRAHVGGFGNWPMSPNALRPHFASGWQQEVENLFLKFRDGGLTKFEKQLIRMWVWLGRGYMARDQGERFLFDIVALECGLGLSKEEKIRKTLAMYSAHLLASTKDERAKVKDRVLRWYDARSGIVHSGEDAPNESDCTLAEETILQLAKNLTVERARWATPEALKSELDDAMLGGT